MKKNKKRKIIKLTILITLAVVLLLTALILPMFNNRKSASKTIQSQVKPYIAPMVNRTMPLKVTNTGIESGIEDEPGDWEMTKLYAPNGEEVVFDVITGQLMTTKGELLTTVSHRAMARYDQVTQQLLDGANQALEYWKDSVSLKYVIGEEYGTELTTVLPSDDLYLATVKHTDGITRAIYVTRKVFKRDPFEAFITGQQIQYYKYFNVQGREISENMFVEHMKSVWFISALRVATSLGISFFNPILGLTVYVATFLYDYFVGFAPVETVELIYVGTVSEIKLLMEFSTWHPWEKIPNVYCADKNGNYNVGIYINPETNQLYDRFYSPLFSLVSGYPLVYQNNKIITVVDHEEQTIEGEHLINVVTTDFLDNLRMQYVINYITDIELGIFDFVVLNQNGHWYKPNGDNADNEVMSGVSIAQSADQNILKSFGSGISRVISDISDLLGFDISTIFEFIKILFLIIIGFVCLPLIVQLLTFVINSIKKLVRK